MWKTLALYLFSYVLINSSAHAMPTTVAPSYLSSNHHHVPLKADDQGVDLPTVGSSIFDKIFSKPGRNGPEYSIPYPLDQLLAWSEVGASHYVHSLFPFSRSLQRPVDLSYDPLLSPRLVIAPSKGIADNKLFIGYVKATDQIEIISYNDEAGRFEYQIVKEYSRNPKVFYVNRGKCLSCHQGQNPIFSQGPWADSSLGLMGELIGAKLGLPEGERSKEDRIFERLFSSRRSTANVTLLDSLVRTSNALALDERIWIHGCGESRECRLGLLLRTIAPNAPMTDAYFEVAVRQFKNSLLRQEKVFHSILSSTDLGVRELIRKNTVNGRWDLEGVANSSAALMEIITNIYRMSEVDNPATPRPRELSQINLLGFKLSNFTHEDFDNLNDGRRRDREIAEAVLKIFVEDQTSFGPLPIQKPWLMFEILKRLGSDRAQDYERWINLETPEKKLLNEPIPPAFKKRELNVFSRHCASCHASGGAFPPQFLVGEENQVVVQIGTMRDRILFKLENHLMPPDAEKRRVLEVTGDLEILINYLRSLPQPMFDKRLAPALPLGLRYRPPVDP